MKDLNSRDVQRLKRNQKLKRDRMYKKRFVKGSEAEKVYKSGRY
jgi:hypothetical protein